MKKNTQWTQHIIILITLVTFCLTSLKLFAQQNPSTFRGFLYGGEELRTKLGDLELVGDWLYDDLDEGFRRAEKSDKPLLVVFRCVT
ncbi:hypothetical protein HYR99_21905 [Candidatus Poribacteria bacterium]|nr:hypothetical protein [Candidatus Poribacteria bacterium]